jgi:thiamine-monophosphate kinase
MNEFELIEKYFDWQVSDADILGVGDDCALISIDAQQQIATSVDTLIEGVHFPRDTSPESIAHKALAVNLSDLAAMGATPKYFTLALTLPEFNVRWLDGFSTALKTLANQYNIILVGGDTTRGRLSITINATGSVLKNQALLRSAAQVDDIIFISNTLGDSALAWRQIQQNQHPSEALLRQFNTPEPQIKLGRALAGVANACIDISDGLEQDLAHILKRSNVGASIKLADIPLSDEVSKYVQKTNDWCLPLAGGDDYQLCFTVSQNKVADVKKIATKLGINLSAIGKISKNLGLKRIGKFEQKCVAYRHF